MNIIKNNADNSINISLSPDKPEQLLPYRLAVNHAWTLAKEQGNFNTANYILDQLIAVSADELDVLLIRSYVYLSQYRLKDAAKFSKQVLKQAPHHPNGLLFLSMALMYSGHNDEAIKQLNFAIKFNPGESALYKALGEAYSQKGDERHAASSFTKALSLNKSHYDIYYLKAAMGNGGLTMAELDNLKYLVSQPVKSPRHHAYLEFACAVHYRGKGKIDEEFIHLNRGNQLMSGEVSWNYTHERIAYEKMKSLIVDESIKGLCAAKNEMRPLLIAGLPRSGSTLLEKIISAHSDVTACGESGALQSALNEVGHKFGKSPDIATWAEAGEMQTLLTELAGVMQDNLEPLDIGKGFFTEKSSFNPLYLGLQLAMFPEARAIDCVREPMDIILSCYQAIFTYGQGATYNLEFLAKNYLLHRDIMEYWQQLFPGRILQVRYEDLVSDQRAVTEVILEFMGLEWQDSCLNFHQLESPTATASKWQVRRPVHTESINRWRVYSKYLQPALDILDRDSA